jgi:hypothetical protein
MPYWKKVTFPDMSAPQSLPEPSVDPSDTEDAFPPCFAVLLKGKLSPEEQRAVAKVFFHLGQGDPLSTPTSLAILGKVFAMYLEQFPDDFLQRVKPMLEHLETIYKRFQDTADKHAITVTNNAAIVTGQLTTFNLQVSQLGANEDRHHKESEDSRKVWGTTLHSEISRGMAQWRLTHDLLINVRHILRARTWLLWLAIYALGVTSALSWLYLTSPK